MEQVCPLCNGLQEVGVHCTQCGTIMVDDGMQSDFVGPYSPYELTAHVRQDNGGRCTHVVHCPECGKQSHVIVQSVLM